MELSSDASRLRSAHRTSLTASTQSLVLKLVRGPTQALHSIRDDVLDTGSDRRLPPICLSRPFFWAAWVFMFALQIAVMLYMLVFGILYYRLAQPLAETVRVVYYLPGLAALRAIAIILLLVVCLYLLNLKRMVSASLEAGRPAFWRMPSKAQSDSNDDDSDDEASDHSSRARHFVNRCCSSLWLTYRTVFGRRGIFGIENRYFDQVLILREGVEIVSQSYQSFRMSQFVAIASINTLSCLLLVVNCWSTPLVHLLIRTNTSAQRVVCLAIDVLLQFVWAVAIPVKLMAPFIRVYNKNTQRFPEVYASDNVFMLNWEMHSQQVLASSIVDFLSKLTPLISILAACRGIGTMLEERSVVLTSIVPDVPCEHEKRGIKPKTPLFQPRQPVSEREFWLRWSHHKMSRTETIAHVVYALWGLVVVANQIHSTRVAKQGASASCLLELRPWFTKQYSCGLVEIDCYRAARLDGLTTPSAVEDHVAGLLSRLNTDTVSFVAFVHCPVLRMPSNLATFTKLRGLEVYNSTIVDWDLENASLRQHRHPILRRVSLVRTPLAQVPGVLLVNDLPQSLLLLNLVATGIKTLPDVVTSTWRHVQYLVLEHSPLDGVPTALPRMVLGRLGLTNSNLTSLPDFPLGKFEHFAVGSNPITQLPTSIGDLSTVAWVAFDHTDVESVPAWITDLRSAGGVHIYGDSTPYCRSTEPAIDCTEVNTRPGGMYPLHEETERRTAELLALG